MNHQDSITPHPNPSPEGRGAPKQNLAADWILLLLLLLLLLVILLYRVPFRSDGADGQDPERGDVHGCTSFFDTTGTSCRKIPAAEWTRRA